MIYNELQATMRDAEIRNAMTEYDKKRADEEWQKLVDEVLCPSEKGE